MSTTHDSDVSAFDRGWDLIFYRNITPAAITGNGVGNPRYIRIAYIISIHNGWNPWTVAERLSHIDFNNVIIVACIRSTFENHVSGNNGYTLFIE